MCVRSTRAFTTASGSTRLPGARRGPRPAWAPEPACRTGVLRHG
jgi:hypothetical protein